MTLSVLIPTYNYCATELVETIDELISREAIEAEIVVADDASPVPATWMDELCCSNSLTLYRAPHNLGRAAIRNQLASLARGTWLWFIDCDTALATSFSLQCYLDNAGAADVLCGGITTPDKPPAGASLRFRYERADSSRRSTEARSREPYRQLSTCNLFIKKSVFTEIMFCEDIKNYGYEDALFGVELEKLHASISHIDNPIVHLGLESNDVFLAKTEVALQTLRTLEGRMNGNSRLQETAHRLQRWKLDGAVRLLYRLFRKAMRSNLLSDKPSLRVFSMYKLGFYLSQGSPVGN